MIAYGPYVFMNGEVATVFQFLLLFWNFYFPILLQAEPAEFFFALDTSDSTAYSGRIFIFLFWIRLTVWTPNIKKFEKFLIQSFFQLIKISIAF